MKYAFFVIVGLVGIASCRTEQYNGFIAPKSLVGAWELRTAAGGWGYREDFEAGNGNRLIFTAQTYKEYKADTLFYSGPYSITTDTVHLLGDGSPYRKFCDANARCRSFIFLNGTLVVNFDAPAADGVAYTYTRISN